MQAGCFFADLQTGCRHSLQLTSALPVPARLISCVRSSALARGVATQDWRRELSSSPACHHIPCRCNVAAAERTAADELPAELQKIVSSFSAVPDAKIKYQQLLFFGKKLPPLPAGEHTEDNKVRGCVSQVWVVPELRDGKVYWRADSDSLLTKGLAALLVQGLSGCSPEDIVRVQPNFVEKLGLGQALTPSRNNGFLNMFKLMQAKSLQLLSQ